MSTYIEVPTWENNAWTTTPFDSRDEFREFVSERLKEAKPGNLPFDETVNEFNYEAIKFNKRGYYCNAPKGTVDYKNYWNTHKERIRNGAIYINNGRTWFLPGFYYMWINFLKIYNKAENKYTFPKIWDSHYYAAIYEKLAGLSGLHSAKCKKRQWGGTYFHLADIISTFWFEEGSTCKMGASDKKYINEGGSWKFLNEYKTFLNKHTAWYRPLDPEKTLMWQQRIKIRENDRDSYVGLGSSLIGVTFEKDPAAGVGGNITKFYHEEAGIAPDMDTTLEFMLPALQAGGRTVGIFSASGSVGDLEQCGPLKQLILKPDENSILSIESDLVDDKGTISPTGLFIPEQWSYLEDIDAGEQPCIDEFGNSLVEKALGYIKAKRLKWKKDLSPEKYQLRISQHPINIAEAFAIRKSSPFPLHLVNAQLKRIEDKVYPTRYVDIVRGESGLEIKNSTKLPISEFPITKKTIDKTGVICMVEEPIKGAPWLTYFASVDPVSVGATTTSDSLFSIVVYKNDVEVTKVDANGKKEVTIVHGGIVCWWTGRFDDVRLTNERGEMIIELYNAWTTVEDNIPGFITHMQGKHKQHYLATSDKMIFYKDQKAAISEAVKYGWHNSGTIFTSVLLDYFINWLKEELDVVRKPDGEPVKVTYGIERSPDPMVCEEMKAYEKGVNVDRLVSMAALITFVKLQEASIGLRKMKVEDKSLAKPGLFSRLSIDATPGKSKSNPFKTSPFRNYK